MNENDDNTLDIQQSVGDVEGDFTKSITVVDMDDGSSSTDFGNGRC